MSRTCLPALLALILSGGALADVSPASVSETLDRGESTPVIEKTVTLPEVTPTIDVVLLVDLSGSYHDDLRNLKTQPGGVDGLAAELFDGVCTGDVECQFALASFVDFPFSSWGSSYHDDYAYRLDLDFTTDRSAFVAAVDAMSTKSGYDHPESQYEALYQVATGAGRDLGGTAGYTDLGEIEPGLNPTFRDDSTRVVVITTDASFHEEGDACDPASSSLYEPCTGPYPGADKAAATDALVDANIRVIGLTGRSTALAELNDLATDTGGASLLTASDSADIVSATLEGIEALTFDVAAFPVDCEPLTFAYTPATHLDVASGGTVYFDEVITVPTTVVEGDLDSDGLITCDVEFRADDTVIGVQSVEIEVILNKPPVAVCQDITVEADEYTCDAAANIDDGSYDPDLDVLTYAYSPAGPYPVGDTLVTLTVTDPDAESDTCTGTVTVVDTTPPVVTVGDPLELWPPNHKYVDFTLDDCDVTIVDSCGGDLLVSEAGVITSITSDEAEEATGKGDGKTYDDMLIDGAADFALRAERDGNGNGRVYHVIFDVSDSEGNAEEATCTVTVPHSKNGTAAIDDGVFWSVPEVPE